MSRLLFVLALGAAPLAGARPTEPGGVLAGQPLSMIGVVLSLARSAMGTQQAPPTIVLTGLAAVLSGHIMAPVAERMMAAGRAAYHEVESGEQLLSAAARVTEPLRA